MRILHLHSSFSPGGKELRAVRLMNAFGPGIGHDVVSAQPGALGAAVVLDPLLDVGFPEHFPSLQGRPTPTRLWHIAQAMQGYDLVLTYNWGAMDAVLAHRLYAGLLQLPPLVHHEDGFNEDEANGLKTSRNLFRRVALVGAAALVVPSRRLEAIALKAWRQPATRLRFIPNGIDCGAFIDKPRPDVLPGVTKQDGDRWVGTMAGLRPVKDLPRLVRAFAGLPDPWKLVILGEGPERGAIAAEAERLGIGHRVHLPGFVPDPSRAVGLFDVFALSSKSEQFPISVVEAMAAGLPVAAPMVGDVADMIAAENASFIVPTWDKDGDGEDDGGDPLATALLQLADAPALRARVGAANRAKAQSDYDEAAMIAAYRAVYGQAMGVEVLV